MSWEIIGEESQMMERIKKGEKKYMRRKYTRKKLKTEEWQREGHFTPYSKRCDKGRSP